MGRPEEPEHLGPFWYLIRNGMLDREPPDHTRLRRLVAKAFTPRMVERLRGRVQATCDRLVGAIADAGGGDLVAELAYPLPAAVIGTLLGLSPEDASQFRALAAVGGPASGAGDHAARDADARLEAVFAELIDRRRRHPTDDVLGRLVRLCDQGRLSEAELMSTVMLLYIAGVLTTTSFIGNAVLALHTNPGALRRLRDDPALLPAAVEEVLRWDNPVPVVARNVFEPTAIGGCDLEAGDRVVVVLASGNRDPARFDQADEFRLDRRDNVPLSFGWGVHRCLGAHLARLEGEVVLGRLLARCPSFEVLDPDPPRLPGLMIRGPASLPVALAG
jgi:cytochrome P450